MSRQVTTEEFIEKAKKIHDNKYSYSDVVYKNSRIKIKIYCNTYKKYFYQQPNSHLNRNGCPRCNNSKGESRIKVWLDNNKIFYKEEYKFQDCKNRGLLRFDFAIFDKNSNLSFLIEYDGIQHFKPMRFFGKEESLQKLKNIKTNDQIKNKFCLQNNLKLVRISYREFKNIEKILNKLVDIVKEEK